MEKEKPKFNILRDEPLTNKEADRFGYSDIADKLIDIIQEVKSPFTIGLYGKWGSGKTSICKLVEKNLEDINDFKIFYFDVWKYEKDSFRRQFLIELDNKIFGDSLQYREKLNQSLTIPKTLSLKENIKIFLNDLIIKIFGLFGLITLVLVLLKFAIFPYIASGNTIELFKKFIDLGLFINLFYFLLNSFKLYQGYIQIHKTDSAEGFEHFYEEALKKLNKRKLLVIIDNLDRLTSKKAVGVLSDIKTFLAKDSDNNNAVFLIPCDNEALSKHLYHIYDKEFDADEFLRKFFNLTFKIPKLLNIELDDYTSEKLKETEIPELKEKENYYPLVFVITNAFRDNPREIIQFINSLVASYLLAKKRNLAEILSNIAFLAKILVIRQKWPLEYAEIENKILRTGLKLDEAVRTLHDKSMNWERLDEFLRITSSINADNHDIFFSLHKSKQEETLSEWTSFILSAEEKRDKDLKDLYAKIKNNNKIQELNYLLTDYYKKNKENKTKLLNVFISIVKILESEEQLEDFKEFLLYSFEILDEPNIYIGSINDINFANLLNENAIRIIPKEFYDRFLSTIISVLTSIKDANQPAIELSKGIELFQLISVDLIWTRVEKHYNSLEDAKNRFIQIVNVNEIINNADGLNKFISFILDAKPITTRVLPASLNKINEIIIHPSIGESVWQILEAIKQLLDKIQHPDTPDAFYITSVQNISNTIIDRYNQILDWTKRSVLIKIAIILRKIKGNSSMNQLTNIISNFIGDINNSINNIVDSISKKELINLIESEQEIKNKIPSRSKSLPDIIIQYDLRKYLTDQEIQGIFNSLISYHERFIQFLKYLKFELPEDSKKWSVQSMIGAINSVPEQIFEEWLDYLSKLKLTDYPPFISDLYSQLKSAKNRGEIFNEKVKAFVKKNKKIFGEAQAEDLLN